MNNKKLHILSAFIALVVLVSCFSVTASAAEVYTAVSYHNDEASFEEVIYLNDWAEFSYGTDLKALSNAMPSGYYTLYYSVSQPTTLILWSDSFTQYSFSLSGSGTQTIYVGSRCTQWQCVSNYANVSASFTIE